MPYTVALTGGIGSGKSRVAELFLQLGAAVIDTDEISRSLTRVNGAALPAIRAAFGEGYAMGDGGLDRAAMRRTVFSDPSARTRLEAILHPLIGAEVKRRLSSTSAVYVVLVVPLLVETGAYRELVDRVLVVDCSERTQIERTMARDGCTKPEVQAVMASQVSREARLRHADDVIINEGSVEELLLHVQKLDRSYRLRASR